MSTQMNPEEFQDGPHGMPSALPAAPSPTVWKPGDPERRAYPENRREHSDRIHALFRKFPKFRF